MHFDVFISYARKGATEEAAALKQGLESYAREWNKARSTNVYLDTASMIASASLEATITHSLIESDWLIVLLTEAAATSPWVDQEVSWWVEHKGTERMLLVQVDGVVEWIRGRGFSPDSTAVPPALRRLTVEPGWVDLTWFDEVDSLGRDDPRLAGVVLQLFCPIHGLNPNEAVALRDANVRRARRLTRVVIASLSTLLVLALISAGFAVIQMRTAQQQTDLATVRLLDSESQRIAGQNVGLSRLLAVEAATMSDDDQTRRTLFQSLAVGEHLAGELYHPVQPQAIAASEDGSVVVVADASGQLSRWDVRDRTVQTIGTPCKSIYQIQVSADARVVVGACIDDDGFVFLDDQRLGLGKADYVTVSPSGQTIAYLAQGTVTVDDLSSSGVSQTNRTDVGPLVLTIALRDDQTLSAISQEPSYAAVYSIAPWAEISRTEYPGVPPEYKRILSRTGEAFFDSSNVWALPATGAASKGPLTFDPVNENVDFAAAALSDKGELFAYALSRGSIQVTVPAPTADGVVVRAELEAGANIGPIVIAGSDHVIAAHDGVVSEWDLSTSSGAVTRSAVALEPIIGGRDVIPNGPGTLFAYGNSDVFDSQGKVVWSGDGGEGSDSMSFLDWRNETQFFVLSTDAISLISLPDGQVLGSWPAPTLDYVVASAWDSQANRLRVAGKTSLLTLNPESSALEEAPLNGRVVNAISRDGARMLVDSGESVSVWDSELKHELYQTTARSAEASFTDDGNLVIWGDSGREYVPLDGGKAISVAGNKFSRVPVSPDGKLYLTTDVRGYVRIVSRETGQEWGRIPAELFQDDTAGESADAAFSGDGSRILIVASAGVPDYGSQLSAIDLRLKSMVDAVCETVRRGLEPEEWTGLTGRDAPSDLACRT